MHAVNAVKPAIVPVWKSDGFTRLLEDLLVFYR